MWEGGISKESLKDKIEFTVSAVGNLLLKEALKKKSIF